jgi:RNA-directed DNA polymerase
MSNMTSTKSYSIAKHSVWEAYQLVKANRGAAGIDEETITMFEQDLSRNLYKLWNRMSSGSYFPPSVKQVEIPKAKGGTRRLGVPTVNADCTGPQFGFGMGGDLSSVSPTSRPAL